MNEDINFEAISLPVRYTIYTVFSLATAGLLWGTYNLHAKSVEYIKKESVSHTFQDYKALVVKRNTVHRVSELVKVME